jgi:hypothetical protein
LFIEGDQQVNRLLGSQNFLRSGPDGKSVVPPPNSGLIPLSNMDKVPVANQGLAQLLADGDQPLSRFTPDDDI